jgi:GT2 family glycosyltransferase/glycosyltransferase involved in cell wall biosynthesis
MSSSPSVSVIVVNLNGQALLGECLDSLVAQDYPQSQVEIIMVDNGSTDGSIAFVQGAYPSVRVIAAGHNLGFAGGNNLGARTATGEYLALINNDARADPRWLQAMVEEMEKGPEVACAASKILGPHGKTIDFVGPVMNLYGRAFQIDEGMPLTPGFYDEPRELLAPCGGAMAIRRDVFWEIGGFDEDYIAYYEDVDLGWRLWLLGYNVLFVPQAIAYHRPHQTGVGFPTEQRYALSEVNALRTVIKNYEEENLWRVLPFSLFMGVKRSLDQAGLDREQYKFGHPMPGNARKEGPVPEPQMTRVAMSFLVAIERVAEEMPHLLEKRRRIQAARVRSDEEIFGRFPMRPDNWLFPWRQYHVLQDQLATEFEVPDALRPQHGTRLLIIAHGAVGAKMGGPAIRAWEMACALSERFDVVLAAPGEPSRSHPGLRVVGYDTDDPYYASLDPYIFNTDVVLAIGSLFARIPRLRDLNKPAIVDLYDPYELEKLAFSPAIGKIHHLNIDIESVTHLRLEGAIGDFFICASERQRDFWLGVLLASGRLNTVTYAQDPTLRTLIDVVPFGVPPLPPNKQRAVLKGVQSGIGLDDKVLLWNGGLWQWFDPLLLLDALVQVLNVRDDVKIFFAAGRHFDPKAVPEMPIYAQTVERCRELDLLDRHVFFGDWVPYDERGDYLLEADLGVSVHRPNIESRFASRTRLLDCVWAGLPVVSTAGDPLSDWIAEHGLGRAVPPSDSELLAQAILEMLADDHLRDRVAKTARALHSDLAWTRVVEPITNFLDRVAFAPDGLEAARTAAHARQTSTTIARLQTRIQNLEQQVEALEQIGQNVTAYAKSLEAHIEAIKQGRVMRLMRVIDDLLGRE